MGWGKRGVDDLLNTAVGIFFFKVVKYTFSHEKNSWKYKVVEYASINLFLFVFRSIGRLLGL